MLGLEKSDHSFPRYRRPLTRSRYQIRLNDWKKSPQRIKLEKLATEVSKCIERFIKVGRERFFPAPADMVRGKQMQTGKYPDRECSGWRVGPEFIEIDRLVLVALDHVSKGSWQARIGVLEE